MSAPRCVFLLMVLACVPAGFVRAEDRTINGTGNNLINTNQGAAGAQLRRGGFPGTFLYDEEYADGLTVMLTEFTPDARPNARNVSNLVSAQTGTVFNARGLSDYIWAWGQFVDHDISLSTSRAGAATNGSQPIPIHNPNDPLFPSTEIAFTRHDFVLNTCVNGVPGCRQQINEITSYLDGSAIYGSDSVRAAALRTSGGTGAKLQMGAGNLLPFNNAGLEMENPFGSPTDPGLFLAGDIRANENPLLTSMHTVFNREHNRLVDKINTLPLGSTLNEGEKYELARKIVGAQLQIITYNEFLPALVGVANAPTAAGYSYDPAQDASVTTSFATAAYRFGHSAVSPNLQQVNNDGSPSGSLSLADAFFNPSILGGDPGQLDKLLKGAATQVSQEIDTMVVDELRNMLFVPPGPPGAVGLDLAAINIHRGRDHGLSDYNALRFFYNLSTRSSIGDITTDPNLVQALETAYSNDLSRVDAWVGGLAENHLPGSSVGELFGFILVKQFEAFRDGDRLFYLSDDLGLYSGGNLLQSITDIIDLDTVTLSDVLKNNTSVTNLQDNVFFAQIPGDFDQNLLVDAADLSLWETAYGAGAGADADGDGDSDGHDFLIWQQCVSGGAAGSFSILAPEPPSVAIAVLLTGLVAISSRRR